MTTLKEILKRLEEVEAEASVDLASVAYDTRLGAEGRIRAAQAELPLLKKHYLDAVMPTLLLVAVTGPGAARFGQLATEKFQTVSVNYESLPDRMYTTLKQRRAGDTYGQTEHWMVLTEIGTLKNELNITQIQSPTLTAMDAYFNQELRKGLGLMLAKTYGNSLSSIVLRKVIGETALTQRFNGKFLPVVVYNYSDSLGVDQQYLPAPIATIDVGEDVTESLVATELKRVNEALKKSRRKASKNEDQATEGQE